MKYTTTKSSLHLVQKAFKEMIFSTDHIGGEQDGLSSACNISFLNGFQVPTRAAQILQ